MDSIGSDRPALDNDDDDKTHCAEITPKMVEAAASVLLEVDGIDLGEGYACFVARKMLAAAFENAFDKNSPDR